VQPVQLSLLPDQVPAPPVITQLPAQQVDSAVMLLASLIARTAARDTAAREVGADE
jgi:hypothetical protein